MEQVLHEDKKVYEKQGIIDFAKRLRQCLTSPSKLGYVPFRHPSKCWRSPHLGEVRILTPKWFKKRFHTFLPLITMAVSKL